MQITSNDRFRYKLRNKNCYFHYQSQSFDALQLILFHFVTKSIYIHNTQELHFTLHIKCKMKLTVTQFHCAFGTNEIPTDNSLPCATRPDHKSRCRQFELMSMKIKNFRQQRKIVRFLLFTHHFVETANDKRLSGLCGGCAYVCVCACVRYFLR